jgi:branched-chain amino acid transport system permease protein
VSVVIQHVVDAASLGGIYALAALGIGLIFGIMGLINFAHGDFIMIGAYGVFLLSGRPMLIIAVTAVAVVVLLALSSDRLVFRRLRGADGSTLLIASFGFSYFLQNVILMIFGGRPKAADFGRSLVETVTIGSVRISKLDIFTIVTTALLLIGLTLFLRKTRYGIEMRAAASDFRMARLLGIRANRVVATAFALSGLLAAAVSLMMVAQTGAVSPHMGLILVLFAFVATIMGGMGSLPGAALGGFLVGFASVGLQTFLPPHLRPFRDGFLFAIVVLLFILFPGGLMAGKRVGERV